MKKIILLLVAVAFILPVYVFGQSYAVDQGSIMIGGESSALFGSASGDLYENADGDGVTMISVTPILMYFMMPGLGIGGSLNYESQSQGDNSQSTMGVGPTVAYLVGDANSSLYPFARATLLYGSTKYKNGAEFTVTSMNIIISAGAMFMAGDHIGINLFGYYSMDSMKHEDADEAIKGNVFGVGVGVNGFIF